jgi:hypothetical protein
VPWTARNTAREDHIFEDFRIAIVESPSIEDVQRKAKEACSLETPG